MAPRLYLAVASLLAGGCGDIFFECPATDQEELAELPDHLGDTGLYGDIEARELGEGVIPYRPRFELWSDGATKRRWLWLPQGAQIDSSEMNDWQFPVGTRVWKEFSVAGVPIETRLIVRRGPGPAGWRSVSYLWQGSADAVKRPLGVLDAGRTDHDVPASGECVACHGGRRSFILGFSAVQLAGPEGVENELIAKLVSADRFTHAPPLSLPLPGDESARKALGYLHANCGHCHNSARPATTTECFDPSNRIDTWLTTESMSSVEATPTYRSTVPDRIVPGRPGASLLVDRMNRRTFIYGMPPLGTETVDRDAVEWVSSFIRNLR